MKIFAVAAVIGASGVAAHADLTIALGTEFGQIIAGKPGTYAFNPAGVCGGPVQAMAHDGPDMLLGDTFGQVYRFRLAGIAPFALKGQFTLPEPATSMAMDGNVLVVGAKSGNVRRVNPVTGAVLKTVQLPMGTPADAMMIHDGTLYVGGNNTLVFVANPNLDNFQFLTACGGAVDSMAISGSNLFLGTLTSTVYRFDLGTSNYLSSFQLPSGQVAMGTDTDGTVLAVSVDGKIYQFDPNTGAEMNTFVSGANGTVGGMLLIDNNPFCSPDIDNNALLSIDDFISFQTAFAIGDNLADFDQDGVLSIDDFITFQNTFALGCGF